MCARGKSSHQSPLSEVIVRGRGGGALGTGRRTPVQESGEAGPRCTPAGLPVLSTVGQPDSRPVLSARSEGLAVHKGPPTPGRVSEAGSTLRWSFRGGVDDESRSRLPEGFLGIQDAPHVSKVKLVAELDLVPPSEALPFPRVVDGAPAYTFRFADDDEGSSTWSTGRGMVRRHDRGSPAISSWTTAFSATVLTRTSLVGHLEAPVEGEGNVGVQGSRLYVVVVVCCCGCVCFFLQEASRSRYLLQLALHVSHGLHATLLDWRMGRT
ncbi:uncharacterized protein LOC130528259 [Takifugu flavidus]|uniref:uncharacterized protein LOC130528259 n=1 Tax=Takifugu flavidus TaxID=433684 RepID=UPI002544A383|nr:uncharacterized protein LOC130528259 [Takifugu flavidus]